MFIVKKSTSIFFVLVFLFVPFFTVSSEINSKPNVQIYSSPRTGSFTTGSVFDVGIYLDTKGQSINTVDLRIKFDPKKISVAKPSGGKSIFGIWVDAPTYDNSKGVISMGGVIPEGIVTNSGLITTITFKALNPGDTTINISSDSAVYLNDGIGSKTGVSLGQSNFSIQDKVKEGIEVRSDTHPFEDSWYNNNNPIFNFSSIGRSDGYSVLLDSNPNTVPENSIKTTENNFNYNNIKDGIWYFHVKSKDKNGWTNASTYRIKIDTTGPEEFKPVVSKIVDDKKTDYMLMFNTQDNLSGVDHYEVGIIKNNRDNNTLPVFVQAESPYVLPINGKERLKIIVKAFDVAGNVRESYVSLYPDRTILYTLLLVLIIIILFILHYFIGHHIAHNLKKAFKFFKEINENPIPEPPQIGEK